MPRAKVALQFTDGSVIDEWVSFSIRDTYTDPIGQFTFVAQPARSRLNLYREKLRKGELFACKVNEVPQFVGLIQTNVETISAENGVTIEVSGGSPLLTPYEGAAVVSTTDFASEVTFHSESDIPATDFVLRLLEPYGFSAVIADDRTHVDVLTGRAITGKGTSTPVTAMKHKDAQASAGEAAYTCVARVITRLGAMVRLSWDGQLMITRPDYDQPASYRLVQDFDGRTPGDRFFGDITITDTNEGQFSVCAVRGQRIDNTGETFTSRPIGTVASTDLNASRPPYSSSVAVFKPAIVIDKSSRDENRAKSVAKLKLGLAARNAFTVSGQVDGFVSGTGRVWTTDTVARVFIDGRIDEDMWIYSRTLIQNAAQGQFVQLTVIPKGSLVLGDLPSG
jgi:hypothetical protein